MAFGDILGKMLQENLGGRPDTQSRMRNSLDNLTSQGGGLGEIFGQLQGQQSGASQSSSSGLGGLAEMAKEFLGKEQIGGLSTGQIGGIGAAAGALLGGGVGGAARGGLMAVLGTMALGALKGAGAKAQSGAQADDGLKQLQIEPQKIEELTGPAAQKLLVRAMVSAAKADGQVDKDELEKIISKIGGDGVSEEEKQFVLNELRSPLDINSIASEVKSPEQAAEVYAASIIAIDIDSEQEKRYLAELAQAMRMDPQTVVRLHQMVSAA